MERKKLQSLIIYILVAVSGMLYILQCSSWTSPLYPYAYGYDCSWYSLMGRAITLGKVPYRDYFDLKGPVLFFYEAFGQLFLKGRNGIFLIQCISIGVTAVIVWKTARLYLNRICTVLVLISYYFVAYALIWGGNTVEELFMPFSVLAVYLVLDYIKNKENALFTPERSALLMGIGFGVYFFSKMTVAAVICASVLTVTIFLIKKKEWSRLASCALNFIIGITIVAVPLFIYFIVNGALKDFIYCAFLFAFKRSTDYYEAFSLKWELNLVICYASFFFGLCMSHENEEEDELRLYILLTAPIQYAFLHLGTPYLYYFLSQMPVFVLLMILYLRGMAIRIERIRTEELKPELRDFALLFSIVIVIYGYQNITVDKFRENLRIREEEWGKTQVLACREIYELVPEWERDQIFNLESGMIYYEVNQNLPTNKYPVNLPYFLHLDPRIKTNVMNKLILHTPKWIISEDMFSFDDEDVKEFVGTHYEKVAENDGEELYRYLDIR